MGRERRERYERLTRQLDRDFDPERDEPGETVCVKCLGWMKRGWAPGKRGHRVYSCTPGCTPAAVDREIGGGMECDGCGTLMPSRGRMPTTRGLMCLHCWIDADGGEVIYDIAMCPQCGESAGSPAWDGYCSDYCRGDASAAQGVA